MNQLAIVGGAILISLPFIGVFAMGVKLLGWKETTLVITACADVVILIAVGLALVSVGFTGQWPH